MSENELFSRRYSVPAQQLLDGLQQALASMPTVTLQRVDDTGQGVEFQTTFTLTSWGETMRATVEPAGEASVLRVSGQPRVGAMSTPWGEEAHATQIEQQLFAALDALNLATAVAESAARGGSTGGGGSASSTARQIMTPSVEVIDANATIAEAAELLAAGDIGALPICNQERHLQGMLTDRDIVVKVVAQGKDPASTKVSDVIPSTEVVTIGADDTLDEALRTMKVHKVRRLPVIDGTELVGIISQGDLAQHLPEDRIGDLVEVISSAPAD